MKVAPVSADLLIKLALVALVVGGGVYLVRRASNAIGGAFDVLPDLPDVGAWVDSAARFAGDVGDTVGSGAGWVGDTFGGTAHITNPATFPTLDNQWGIYLTPEQRQVYDTQVSRPNPVYRGVNAIGGSITGTRDFSLGSWIYDLVNPEPVFTPFNPDPVQDIRRIDNALGY